MNLDKALSNAAESDLTLARKQGSICIAQTKRGNLELTYNQDRSYTLKNFNTGEHIMTSKKKVIKIELEKSYQIVTE